MHTKIWRKKCIENRNEERNRKGKKQKQIDIRKRRNKVQSKRNKQKNVISSFRSFWAAMISMNNKVFIEKNIFRVSCRLSILMVISFLCLYPPLFSNSLFACLPICLFCLSVFEFSVCLSVCLHLFFSVYCCFMDVLSLCNII